MINLKGRTVAKEVASEQGKTLLDIAMKNGVDWGFSCTRGTCARCRCHVTEGLDQLAKPTEEEEDRLTPEELEEGFRLGCQAIIRSGGPITAVNKTYF